MTALLYVCICALMIVRLSLNVIGLRRQHKVSLGDGGHEDLQRAIRAHANAIEYMPIGLLLLLGLEFNQAPLWLVHILGVAFVAGRVLHAFAMPTMVMPRRVLGMQITIFTLLGLVAANLIFLPYAKVF